VREVIRIEHLKKNFGKHEVLKDISLTVNSGEVLCLIGASGSGKSTLLRCINVLETPTDGKIIYHGKNVLQSKNISAYRTKLGMVFQQFNLFNNLNVLENCVVGQVQVLKKKRPEAVETAMFYLSKVGMAGFKNAKPAQLSGGQKQRCACARAMANEPSLLLADEPTGALDSHASQVLLETFCRLNEMQRATILMVTHDAFSASYCSRILFLRDGKIFHELIRGERDRRAFLQEILDVLSLMGGESSHDTKISLS